MVKKSVLLLCALAVGIVIGQILPIFLKFFSSVNCQAYLVADAQRAATVAAHSGAEQTIHAYSNAYSPTLGDAQMKRSNFSKSLNGPIVTDGNDTTDTAFRSIEEINNKIEFARKIHREFSGVAKNRLEEYRIALNSSLEIQKDAYIAAYTGGQKITGSRDEILDAAVAERRSCLREGMPSLN